MAFVTSGRTFGFVLTDLSRRYVRRFEQRAQQLGLTLAGSRTLAALHRNEGVSQARLAELADLEPMTMVRILDRMEAAGLLKRRVHPEDRRVWCLYLTHRAKPVLDKIMHVSELTRAETFAGMSRSEEDALVARLERMHSNLADLQRMSMPSTGEAPVVRPTKARANQRKTAAKAFGE